MYIDFIVTGIISLVGGMVFRLLHLPLPWLLGPMTAIILWRVLLKKRAWWPLGVRNAGYMVVGYIMGSSFTAATVAQISIQLPFMAMVTVSIIAFSLLMGYCVHRWAGISMASGFIGSIPGGLPQMVVLGEEVADADLTVVAFMQTIRLLMVVFLVPVVVTIGLTAVGAPMAAGIPGPISASPPLGNSSELFLTAAFCLASPWVAQLLRMPAPFMLGPILAAAILVLAGITPFKIPVILLILSQISIGAYLGLSVQINSLPNWQKLLVATILCNAIIISFAFGLGYLLSRLHSMPFLTACLSTTPGGLTELGIFALAVGADLSVITAYQMFRLFSILFLATPFLRRRLGKNPAPVNSLPDHE